MSLSKRSRKSVCVAKTMCSANICFYCSTQGQGSKHNKAQSSRDTGGSLLNRLPYSGFFGRGQEHIRMYMSTFNFVTAGNLYAKCLYTCWLFIDENLILGHVCLSEALRKRQKAKPLQNIQMTYLQSLEYVLLSFICA